MKTYYASPERSTEDELEFEIKQASENPIIDGVMKSISGLFAVLNEHRQILAVNSSFLKMLGMEDVHDVLGLRPGEAVNCINAGKSPYGCGTAPLCSSCGAAIAIVASMGTKKPAERNCAVTVEKNGEKRDLCYQVRAFPITIEKKLHILLFLQDITNQQRWIAMEHTFFHDINNIINGIVGYSQMMEVKDETELRHLAGKIKNLTLRLSDEVSLQRLLASDRYTGSANLMQDVSLPSLLEEIKDVLANHPASAGKDLKLPENLRGLTVSSNYSALLRILMNMLINALEATTKGGSVKLWIEQDNGSLAFCVWNREFIPDEIQKRIFQRYFTTKKEGGRGLGTFSMKLLGEEFLGGKVDFVSFESEGTVFRFTLRA